MLLVANHGFGSYWAIPEGVKGSLGWGTYEDTIELRSHPVFINWVRENWFYTRLNVVVVPDGYTDIIIHTDDDGYEHVFYALEGKIFEAKGERL